VPIFALSAKSHYRLSAGLPIVRRVNDHEAVDAVVTWKQNFVKAAKPYYDGCVDQANRKNELQLNSSMLEPFPFPPFHGAWIDDRPSILTACAISHSTFELDSQLTDRGRRFFDR
jgi:hypothetical protein